MFLKIKEGGVEILLEDPAEATYLLDLFNRPMKVCVEAELPCRGFHLLEDREVRVIITKREAL